MRRHSIDLSPLPWLSCIQCTEEGGGCKPLSPAVLTALRQAVTALLHPAAELSSGSVPFGGLREEPQSPTRAGLAGPEREPSPGHINIINT